MDLRLKKEPKTLEELRDALIKAKEKKDKPPRPSFYKPHSLNTLKEHGFFFLKREDRFFKPKPSNYRFPKAGKPWGLFRPAYRGPFTPQQFLFKFPPHNYKIKPWPGENLIPQKKERPVSKLRLKEKNAKIFENGFSFNLKHGRRTNPRPLTGTGHVDWGVLNLDKKLSPWSIYFQLWLTEDNKDDLTYTPSPLPLIDKLPDGLKTLRVWDSYWNGHEGVFSIPPIHLSRLIYAAPQKKRPSMGPFLYAYHDPSFYGYGVGPSHATMWAPRPFMRRELGLDLASIPDLPFHTEI